MTPIDWLFTPLSAGLILAGILRYLVGFTALILSARYRRDRNPVSAALALAFALWTMIGALGVEQNPNAQVTPYALLWLLLMDALFVGIILRRAHYEEATRHG